MSRTAKACWIFGAVSLVLLLCAATYDPTICGNSSGEIARFLRREMTGRGTGPIQLLAVEDDGQDRFAVFRGEKRPDERYVVRFRQNEDGNYEVCFGPAVCTARTRSRASTPSSCGAIPAVGRSAAPSGMSRNS